MNDSRYINTFQNTLVKGVVNPLRRDNLFTNIHFNTKYRDNYYASNPSDYHLTLPQPIDNVVSLKLTSLVIPKTWYLFSETLGNNKFYVTLKKSHDSVDGKMICVEIPDGNYTAEELELFLNKSYFKDAVDGEEDDTITELEFNITKHDCKTSFSLSGKGEFYFDLDFSVDDSRPIVYNAGWILGFRHGSYVNCKEELISEALFDNQLHRYIYFCLDDFNKNVSENNIVFFENSAMSDDVMAKVYLQNESFKYVVDNSTDDCCNHVKTRRYFGPINLKKMKIKLLDQYGRLVQLNNMDYSFTLEVEQKYKD